METILNSDHLSFSYDSTLILEDITFTVQRGEFIGIIGPNGGGKTTLLHLIMGLLKPQLGKITLFGSSPKNSLTKMGWVPQSFHYDRNFPISVLEVVLQGTLSNAPWWGGYSKENKNAAKNALEKMSMTKWLHHPFSELSGGQRQRVLVARAIVQSPELLLLDEATTGIDRKTQEEIYELLSHLKKEMTILMVTHDLEAVVNSVEKIFCVEKTLSILSPKEVCEHYTLGLYHPPLQQTRKP